MLDGVPFEFVLGGCTFATALLGQFHRLVVEFLSQLRTMWDSPVLLLLTGCLVSISMNVSEYSDRSSFTYLFSSTNFFHELFFVCD